VSSDSVADAWIRISLDRIGADPESKFLIKIL
jgi:hypothetical protein